MNSVVVLIRRVHTGAILNVLICERWSCAGRAAPVSGLFTPIFKLSIVLGVWNHERVY